MRVVIRSLFILVLSTIFTAALLAQTGTGSLHGQVSDPSGAVVIKAKVTAKGEKGATASVVTDSKGSYELKGLKPGKYTLQISAEGFSPETQEVELAAGAAQTKDITLSIQVAQQAVTVEEDAQTVSTEASSNASAVVLKGADLDALSDDPDELQSDLLALAGPSAGPDGGEIYIDGFSNGQLPPKSAIREIRVNSNAFSAQYDRMGFGRVEVFTKPGSDKFRGQFMLNTSDSSLNSLNPYLTVPRSDLPTYRPLTLGGNISGPVGKKASFFFSVQRRSFDDLAIFNAKLPCSVTSDPTCYVASTGARLSPSDNLEISPRFDYQLTPTNSLSVRYERETSKTRNGGISQTTLPDLANNSDSVDHSVRISDTQMISATMINETRFQFTKSTDTTTYLKPGMTISVPGMFTIGGSSSGNTSSDQTRYEFQNYTSKMAGKHSIKFGGRLRYGSQESYSPRNWYGTISYRDMASYYQGIWQQYTVSKGNPSFSMSQTDLGVYAEDDWKVLPKVNLSYGLRMETQSNDTNHVNLAPRIAVAWAVAPKTVLRAGFGMFYNRFRENNVQNILRTNSSDPLLNYSLQNTTGSSVAPDFNNLNRQDAVVYNYLASNFKNPYTDQIAITLERQLNRGSNLSVSYVRTLGIHQTITQNSGALQGIPGPYNYVSAGTFKQNQLMLSSRVTLRKYLSLFSNYSYSKSDSNTGAGFPSTPLPTDPLNLSADWGRSSFDVRHRGMIGGSITLPLGVSLNPMINIQSGTPYTILAGTDLNGDTINNNDRPWYSTGCGNIPEGSHINNIYNTTLGCFSIDPASALNGAKLPINSVTGPGRFTTTLRLSKTFGIGKKAEQARGGASGGPGGPGGPGGGMGGPGGGMGGPGGGPGGRGGGMGGFMGMGGGGNYKYNLTLGVNARNLFNTFNKGTPVNTLTSGNFGQAISTGGGGFGGGFGGGMGNGGGSANRRIDFSLRFTF